MFRRITRWYQLRSCGYYEGEMDITNLLILYLLRTNNEALDARDTTEQLKRQFSRKIDLSSGHLRLSTLFRHGILDSEGVDDYPHRGKNGKIEHKYSRVYFPSHDPAMREKVKSLFTEAWGPDGIPPQLIKRS